ncbi:high-affinity branched-chain amino acid transport ATP-binding protein LivF [Klebsiella aerogenes]|nr:high-affinity branched-chain amino acid transport ATP-binding protein LivF [Klebsiella aerogenes]
MWLENGHVVLEDTGDALLANEAVRSAYLGGYSSQPGVVHFAGL